MDFINSNVQLFTLLVSIITLFVAIYIPRKVLINQIYADLFREYRSPEMGAAIFSIFYFYVKDCER